MGPYVMHFQEIDRSHVALVGGKGAHLGELSRIGGIRVPDGFCVTTTAFRRIMREAPAVDDLLERLSRLDPEDGEALHALGKEIRRRIEAIAIPEDLAEAITRSVRHLGEHTPCAVRSSATAEDSPTASFAGQLDSYLGVVGPTAILHHVSRCWASLFTGRAVTYRLRNRLDQRTVGMGVVVQRMVFPRSAGVLFTADPLTGNRKVACVEATFGLAEALVSGRVNPAVYEVRDGHVVTPWVVGGRTLPASSADAAEEAIGPERQDQPALTDAEVVRLARLGRRIEAHFGLPQDVEWCLAGDDFWIVQSRPITTLYPVPERHDGENHVYISVGHQQMMTDAMKPLGISLWQLTAGRPMYEAGGRLFVDVTRELARPASRAGLLAGVGRSDPLIRDALQTLLDRGDFIPSLPDEEPPALPAVVLPPIETDPAIVADLIARSRASVAALKGDISTKCGPALLDFILEDIQELRRILFDRRSHQVIMAAMEATWWLNERLEAWLGEKNAADTLSLSVPQNVTSEMGLALLDVADAIRPYPEVVDFLRQVEDDAFLDHLPPLEGGQGARDAIQAWLDEYGMRGVGEIDITRPRWSERPTMLLPTLLANVENFEPGAGGQRFQRGRRAARAREEELLARLRALPDGERKADETKRMIDRVRTFIGYREYPKYGMICRYFVYKEALLAEAERLVHARVLREKDDIFYLTLQELRDVVRTGVADAPLIRQRRDAFESYLGLTPPRVLTSDGEAIPGEYRREDLPAGALVGLAVSAGAIEGRARVVLDPAEADLEPGDILVTTYTDPSWTPLFVSIAGLVTEVGGLMTHGAVIAREYGVPAVVGVEHATRLIRDGQRIRVHGTKGYVEILR